MDTRPLILHVVYRFSVGGLENGVVNLVNHMPAARWRHAVVSLTEVDPVFAARVQRKDVEFRALHKPPGQGIWQYPQLYRLFRELRPAIVHTRNLAALESQVPAWAAGVPVRLHGEHGREVEDPDGSSKRHQWMRRIYRPFVHRYIALSRDLAAYLQDVSASRRAASRRSTTASTSGASASLPAAARRLPAARSTTRSCGWRAPSAACRR